MEHLYITGCGRSGTTMLGSILGACQGCVATPESDFFLDYACRTAPDRISKNDFLRYLKGNFRFRQWEISVEGIPFEASDFSPFHLRRVVEKTVTAFAAEHYPGMDSNFVRIDHTPSSIKHFIKLDSSFPDAKFIFIIRDPRAVFASVRDLDWGANTALAASAVWIEYAALFYAVQSLVPEWIRLVRYEDIVNYPEKHIRQLCDYAHIEYEPAILGGGGFKLPEYTAKQHAQVGKAPNPANIDKWKDKISEREVVLLESSCGTIMKAFGYDRITRDSQRIGLMDKLSSTFAESYAYLINKIRKGKRERNG